MREGLYYSAQDTKRRKHNVDDNEDEHDDTVQQKTEPHPITPTTTNNNESPGAEAFRAASEREEIEKRKKDEVEDEATRIADEWLSESEDLVRMLGSIHRVLPSNYGLVMVPNLRDEKKDPTRI